MHIFLDRNSKIYTLIVLVTCCVVSAGKDTSSGETTTCSPEAWFGSSCLFRCRCADHADNTPGCDQVTGSCPHACLSGWFGPGCQYRIANSSLPAWATDGNRDTCNTKTTSLSITALFATPTPFSWLMLGASSRESLKQIEVQYTENGSSTKMRCPPFKTVSIATSSASFYTREIFCHVAKAVAKIFITGAGVQNLCSVEISLGRNVAVKQQVLITAPVAQPTASSLLSSIGVVDGVAWHRKGSCLAMSNRPQHSRLLLLLESAVHLSAVSLYLKADAGCCSDVQNYVRLVLLDRKFRTLDVKLTEEIKHGGAQLVYFLSKPALVHMIAVENIRKSNGLYICELEAYGDCPRGRYGPQCESSCNCQDDDSCSPLGQCVGQCPPGLRGSSCDVECSAETYGPDCKLPCSPFCKERRCSHINGTCVKGCEHDFQPPTCLTEKTGQTEKEMDHLYKREIDKLRTTITLAGLASAVLLTLVLACNVYLAIPLPREPQDIPLSPLSTSEFNFVSYDDVKRYEMRKKPSWGSNICDVGEGDEMPWLNISPSMDMDGFAVRKFQFLEETTV